MSPRPPPTSVCFISQGVLDIASKALFYFRMDLDLLATQLREARAARRWSLRDAEQATSVSNAYLSQLEGAKIKAPSPNVLHNLSKAYELSYALLMECAGYPVPAEAQITGAQERFMSRLGRTSTSEQSALLEYLRFLRTKRR